MEHKWVVGVDPGLCNTGVCCLDGKRMESRCITSEHEGASWAARYGRCYGITYDLEYAIHQFDEEQSPLLAMVEGYSHASRFQAHYMGEVGHAIRCCLASRCDEHHIRVIDVAIKLLKKFATGKGGGKGTDKASIKLQVFKRWGVEFDTEHETDAYVLARIGLCLAGLAEPETKQQHEVIATLTAEDGR